MEKILKLLLDDLGIIPFDIEGETRLVDLCVRTAIFLLTERVQDQERTATASGTHRQIVEKISNPLKLNKGHGQIKYTIVRRGGIRLCLNSEPLSFENLYMRHWGVSCGRHAFISKIQTGGEKAPGFPRASRFSVIWTSSFPTAAFVFSYCAKL